MHLQLRNTHGSLQLEVFLALHCKIMCPVERRHHCGRDSHYDAWRLFVLH